MNELDQYESPFVERSSAGGRLLSARAYNALLAGLILVSFIVMGLCARWSGSPAFALALGENALIVTIGCLVGSIVGLIAMSFGRSRESLGLSVAGYALFTATFGFTTSLALAQYSMQDISTALLATAGIVAVFGAAGLAFPQFFAKIQGVLFVALLALVVVEVVLGLMGVSQSFTDIAVVLVFCGFIGWDVYRASTDEPTVNNAIWYAVEMFLDIINVFLRVLDLIGSRD